MASIAKKYKTKILLLGEMIHRFKAITFRYVLPILICFLEASHSAHAQGIEPEEVWNWKIFFGRFHPLVVHLPIGFLLLACVAGILGKYQPFKSLKKITRLLLMLGVISTVLAIVPGYLLSLSVEYDSTILDRHFWLGISVGVVSIIAWFSTTKVETSTRKFHSHFNIVLLVTLAILVMLTGHNGGALTHGSTYLTEYMPDGAKKLIGIKVVERVKPQPITNLNEAVLYRDIIHPILEKKCASCHNATKKKGQLILSNPEGIKAGGKSRKTIVPGKPEESELYKRLLLPEREKKRMPPEGKSELEEFEIEILHWWIKEGASFDTKIALMNADATVKDMLTKFIPSIKTSGIFAKQISIPDPASILRLRAEGIHIIPVAANLNYLEVDFINSKGITARDAKNMLLLKDQITYLKLSNQILTDSIMQHIGKLKNLTRLDLNNTNITDQGIVALQHLENLEYLNLHTTGITDDGLITLYKLKNLKSIYAWETNVTDQGLSSFLKINPSVKITR